MPVSHDEKSISVANNEVEDADVNLSPDRVTNRELSASSVRLLVPRPTDYRFEQRNEDEVKGEKG